MNQMGKPRPTHTSNFLEREKYHLTPCLMIQFVLENETTELRKFSWTDFLSFFNIWNEMKSRGWEDNRRALLQYILTCEQ